MCIIFFKNRSPPCQFLDLPLTSLIPSIVWQALLPISTVNFVSREVFLRCHWHDLMIKISLPPIVYIQYNLLKAATLIMLIGNQPPIEGHFDIFQSGFLNKWTSYKQPPLSEGHVIGLIVSTGNVYIYVYATDLICNIFSAPNSAKVKRCRFIVWFKVWRPIIRLYINFYPPGHWTCSFVK